MTKKIAIFDSTLRDGAQAEGISFSLEDKLKTVRVLDALGIEFIEAGNPFSNPRDLEFFKRTNELELAQANLVAFGSTRRKDISPEEDDNIRSLLTAGTEHIAIFGKCWDFHVTDIIRTSLEENLKMIEDTVSYLTARGKQVFFDAEHFFDGYKHNPEYAISALKAAQTGGARSLVLCDTNGGCLPQEVDAIVRAVAEVVDLPLGIHCHNDSGCAVANSMAAVQAGVSEVQGTLIGIGERCGNANLSTIIANLQLKLGYDVLPPEGLELLTQAAHQLGEIANLNFDEYMPFVGRNAFSHKGGMHVDGAMKDPRSFEHEDPAATGNTRRFLMSEVAGRSTIMKNIQKVAPQLERDSEEVRLIIARLKELEGQGYQFEGAESSFELIIRKQLGKHQPFFKVCDYKIIGEQRSESDEYTAYAMVKVQVEGETKVTAAEGQGPVNALDRALREALEDFYPAIRKTSLTDYKVRVLDSDDATASKVRVLISTTDGEKEWTTIGVSRDIINASITALVDSMEILLLRELETKVRTYMNASLM